MPLGKRLFLNLLTEGVVTMEKQTTLKPEKLETFRKQLTEKINEL